MTDRHCKDCGAGSRRPAPHAGPRCFTHHREAAKAAQARAHERKVQATYGIGAGDYAAIYEAQGGRCAICQRATGKTKRLAVDHDHKTGEVRGLLCGPCNRGVLGHLRDDPEALQRAITYLRDHPAQAVLNSLNTSAEVS